MKQALLLIMYLFLSSSSYPQIKLHPGLFTLGTADKPTNQELINLPFITGVVIRTKWENLEKQQNQFDWTYIDNEIENAKKYGKKSVIQVLGSPSWIRDSLGALTYFYIDLNTYHPTYGDTLFDYIAWDEVYVQRVEKLIHELGKKYSTDTNVVALNAVSGSISRNLPEKIADGRNFWEAYSYNPDMLISKLKRVLDVYMISFPNTFLWSSMDYISFETKATGKNRNYVCGEYAKYGVQQYPDRFGVWREDISGCTIYPPNSGSQWSVMNSYPERTGAQMLWHVQDGPSRMNQCGVADTTKTGVMKAALDKGRVFGMNYFEVYGADVKDTSLHVLFSAYAELLRNSSPTIITEIQRQSVNGFELSQNYPNPFNPSTVISYQLPVNSYVTLKVYDAIGRQVATLMNEVKDAGSYSVQFDASKLSSGIYFARLQSGDKVQLKKMMLLK